MKIFGMGGLELVIILVVILIIFGPKNLPKLGKALGNTVSSLRDGMNAGKKKKEEASTEVKAEAEDVDEAPVAAIEGEVAEAAEGAGEPAPVVAEADEAVEVVTFDDAEGPGAVAAAEAPEAAAAVAAEEAPVEAAAEAPVETAAEASVVAEPAEGASAEDAPKKVVKRVVKKKVATEEPAAE